MRTPILSTALSASITALLALAPSACVVPTDEPASGEAAGEIICGNEDWRDFTSFSADPAYRIGAHYAKGVAALPGCSGALMGPGTLITANHCYNGGAATTAVFGVGWSGAEYEIRGRLVDMGLTSSQVTQTAVPWALLSTFTCTRRMSMATPTYGMRDIDVYDCAPNYIPNLGNVLPGDLWGYLEASAGTRAEGADAYVLSVNQASAYPQPRVLLSPGGNVTDSNDGCVYRHPWEDETQYQNCFEHDADTESGSSGGPILDADHRVFGLVHGHYDADPGANSCGAYSAATNYGSYLQSSGFASGWEASDPLPSTASLVTLPWVGGTTGTLSSLACSPGTLAVGIVGTTYPYDPVGNARVGNFGLVCATYKKTSTDPSARTSTRWSVLAGGSYDTTLGGWSWPFNEYIHEHLDVVADGGQPASFANQQQSLTMCKPGFYMTGLQVHASSYLDKVVKIECTSAGGNHTTTQERYPRKDVGTRSSTLQVVRCPSTTPLGLNDRAITSLRIRAGWLTDGFQVGCRTF